MERITWRTSHDDKNEYCQVNYSISYWEGIEIKMIRCKEHIRNGNFQEDIYVNFPPSYETLENSNSMCKWNKTIDGIE